MAHLLRDGSEVDDPRLDRLKSQDPLSKNFPVQAILATTEKRPRSFTWSIAPRLNQGSEGACFPAGTLVRLVDGSHKKIEEVQLLDEVVTAEGREGKVLQTMVRRSSSLAAVRLRGHMAVHSTPEHPYLTQRGYVAAADLTTDDRVAVTRWEPNPDHVAVVPVDAKGMRGVVSGQVNAGGVISEIAPLPELLSLTPSFGRLIGLYAAEGHTTPNKVVWSFGGDEEETLVSETVDLIKTCFDAVARIQRRPSGAINVVLYGQTWMRLFAALVPGTSKHGDKRLSHHVTAGEPTYLRAVLDGWMDGDGHARRTSAQGVSVCKTLALDMHAIANALGLRPVIRSSAPSLNAHAVTRQQRYEVEYGKGGGKNVQPMTGSAVWRKVMSVKTFAKECWVYNLHVEGDESYVADGLGVHNCVGFGWSHELAGRPVVVSGVTEASARAIYHEAQRDDEWPGGAYPGATPFMEGTSVLAGAKQVHKLGLMEEYRWAFTMQDIILSVGYKGPVVIGVDWYEGMFDTDADGFIKPAGSVAGGHCLVINQVLVRWKGDGVLDMDASYFGLVNSWGPEWGVNGTCKIAVADLEKLRPSGDFCVPVLRKRPS